MKRILIFGGSFDPVHFGHLEPAKKVQDFFHFDQFIFLPCKAQVLKEPSKQATVPHRLKMLQLALDEEAKTYPFTIDLCEIERKSPSYMVLTLQYFRKKFGDEASLTLLLGEDAYESLPEWYQWEKILTLANILVLHRPGFKKKSVHALLDMHQSEDFSLMLQKPYGVIVHFNAGTYDFSSTEIRERIQKKISVESKVASSVLDYIQKHRLYNTSSETK